MKNFLTSILCILTLNVYGQDTTYYDFDWSKVNSSKLAHYYDIVQHDKIDTNKVIEINYFITGQIMSEKNYSNYKDKIFDGKYKEYYKNGQLRRDIDYKEGKLNGKLLTYWDNGNLKRSDTYENGKFIDGKCLNFDGKETIHFDYEIMPKFPGGINELVQYLGKGIKYPKKSERKGVEGRVLLGFYVKKDGTISGIKIINSVNAELDEEAIRVVKKMPKWDPGMVDGEVVRYFFNLPIQFKLN